MKKILLLLGVLWVPFCAYGQVTPTYPVVDLGTITYTTSPFSVQTFSVRNHSDGAIGHSGSGADWTSGFYTTPFNVTGLRPPGQGGHYVYVHLQGEGPSATTEVDNPTCGKLSIANMTLNSDGSGSPTSRRFGKSGGNNRRLEGFTDGFYVAFTATVTPYSFTQTCSLSLTIPGWISWLENDSESGGTYTFGDFTIRVTLVPVSEGLAHDDNAALNFGTFCYSAEEQTLEVTPSGTVGASTAVCSVGNSDISADSFTFTSYSATSFTVRFPTTSATLDNRTTPGSSTLTVNSFTSSCGTSGNSCTVTNGTGTFTVGGTITVPGGATPGDYDGTYQVSGTY